MTSLPLFLASSIALTVAPGPDNLQVVARGISQGRKAGLVSALGFTSGLLFHITVVTLGAAALLASHPLVFNAVKLVGALYLIYLGIKAILGGGALTLAAGETVPLYKVFYQSVIGNVLNPKVTLFFMMFLPQFVNADNGHVAMQMMTLGFAFMAQAVVIFSVFGLFEGFFGEKLRRWPAAGKWLDRGAGVIFIGLGLRVGLLVSR